MKIKITSHDRKKYMLKENKNIDILLKIKKLENKNLDRKDKNIIKLIKTQLKKDWRSPLINYLNKINRKYKK